MKVVVVGAGLGGLSAAIGFARDGHEVVILERASDLTPVGAGIGLWPNALRALAEIGIDDPIRAVGAPFTSTPILDHRGRTLSSFPPELIRRRLGGQPLIAHRADVQGALLAAAAGIPLRLGVAATGARVAADSAAVTVDGGEVVEGDLVIGADGVNSVVRQSLGVPPPHALAVESWRTVLDSTVHVDDAWLSIGHGQQFLATALPGGRLYLGGLLGPIDGRPPAKEFDSVRRAYDGWHEPIPQLVEEMAVAGVRWDPVWHRKPLKSTVHGRVVIIGDAAHPMTPDLGQGGCQAIEDAVSLTAAFRAAVDLDQALHRYDAVRRPRIRRVVTTSHQMGELLGARSSWARMARNALMRAAPTAIAVRQVAAVAGVDAFERTLSKLDRHR